MLPRIDTLWIAIICTVAVLGVFHAIIWLRQREERMQGAFAVLALAVESLFERTLGDLQSLSGAEAAAVAHDLHPDYASTRWAQRSGLKTIAVQHHYAHALACMTEHCLDTPVLAVVWDGTGYGTDGTIWGGEFLRIDARGFTRVASLRPFPLPGGDVAAREPRRSALGVLYAMYGSDYPRSRLDFTDRELDILTTALEKHTTLL